MLEEIKKILEKQKELYKQIDNTREEVKNIQSKCNHIWLTLDCDSNQRQCSLCYLVQFAKLRPIFED